MWYFSLRTGSAGISGRVILGAVTVDGGADVVDHSESWGAAGAVAVYVVGALRVYSQGGEDALVLLEHIPRNTAQAEATRHVVAIAKLTHKGASSIANVVAVHARHAGEAHDLVAERNLSWRSDDAIGSAYGVALVAAKTGSSAHVAVFAEGVEGTADAILRQKVAGRAV